MIPVMGVPLLNQPERLYAMLQSMDEGVHHLVVVDNGNCVDPVALKVLARCERLTLLQFPYNQGVAGSWNTIIKATPFAPYWLIVNFDVRWPSHSLAAFEAAARTDALVLSAGSPPWCAFTLGEDVVRRVGLFDESFHPAYAEDNDYEQRCVHHGVPVVRSGVLIHHDNSSTIRHASAAAGNARTFGPNITYYGAKTAALDFSEGRWDLTRRRELSWD